MSSPSPAHEGRVDLLRSIATLAGYVCDVPIGDALAPDVTRLSRATHGLFVGDAKATETSGCVATRERLEGYLHAVQVHHRPDRPFLLVLAHGDLHDQTGWVTTLGRVIRRAGFGALTTSGSLVLDDDHLLAFVICDNDERKASAA